MGCCVSDLISGEAAISDTTSSSEDDSQLCLFPLGEPDHSVNVIVLYNPIHLNERAVAKLAWADGKPLAAYLDGLPLNLRWSVAINDQPIDSEDWATTFLEPDDFIVIMPVPQGGHGGGKNIIRMVAMLAIAIAAPEIAGLLVPGLVGIGLSALTLGITVVGGLLVNALLPAANPKANSAPLGTTQQNEGLTYGIDGPKNTSGEAFVVPVAYGSFRTGGNIIDQRVDNDGSTQQLYMRVALSEGPIDSIDLDGIEIEEQRHANYSNVALDYRLGGDNQTVSDWFNRTARQVNKGVRLTTTDAIHTTTTACEGFRADFTCPNGLVSYNDQGTRGAYEVSINIKYRVNGTLIWTTLPGSPFTIVATQRSAVRRSFESGTLPLATYDIAVSRTNAESTSDLIVDQTYLADMTEIMNEQIQLNFTAWLAIKVELGSQLNQQPKLTIPFLGRVVNQYDALGNLVATAWSDSPAWVTLDIITHTRYGGGLGIERFDMQKWKQWADYCASKGLKFNGVFDTESNVWDAIQNVLRCGHAQIIMIGTRYSVAMEAPDTPVMMFGMGNILAGTFQIDWLPLQDRANEVEVSYYDQNDHYKRHAVRAVDYDALAAGAPQKLSSITIMGVTDPTIAYNEAWLQIALNKYVLQTVTFESPIEAIGCLTGDVVYVQHDMPQWGYGGRLDPSSTASSLVLDRAVTMDVTGDYRVLVIHSAVQRSGATPISIVSANAVFTTSPISATGYKRLIWRNGGQVYDAAVLLVTLGSPYNEITLDQAPGSWGMNAGATVELWDTDVIEERQVVLNAGAQTTIVPTTPLTITPDGQANFMFGENLKMKKPFRVKKIAGSHEYKRQIICIEYNDSVYGDPTVAAPTPNYSALPPTVAQVTNVDGFEEIFFSGNVARVRFTLTWSPPNSLYEGADIYEQINGNGFNNVGTVRGGASSFPIEVDTGDVLQFKVVPFDGAGDRASFATAGIFEHTVLGLNTPPSDVTNFVVTKEAGGLLFTWNANTDADIAGYEIRQGASWDAASLLVTKYTGNRFFTNKTAAGSFTWLIRAINTNGVYSANAVSLSMTLYAPAQVVGFASVSNGPSIVFNWIPNSDPDVVLYEIREGGNWASSNFIAQVGGNHHLIPNDVPGSRTFWIKAIDSAGVYSTNASFSSPDIAQLPNRNVVFTDDEKAASFPGFKYKCTLVGSDLVMDSTGFYSEYVSTFDMGGQFFARTVIDDAFDSVLTNDVPWSAATFAWNSQLGQNAWVTHGDLNSVIVQRQFATYIGATSADVESFSFNHTLTGIRGTTPTTVVGTASYDVGRLTDGLVVDDVHSITYAVTFPAQFSLTLGFRAEPLLDPSTLFTISDGGSHSLKLIFNLAANSFDLVGSDGVTLSVPNEFVFGDRLEIGISQTASKRRLFIGRLDDLLTVSAEAAAAPIASFTTLNI